MGGGERREESLKRRELPCFLPVTSICLSLTSFSDSRGGETCTLERGRQLWNRIWGLRYCY